MLPACAAMLKDGAGMDDFMQVYKTCFNAANGTNHTDARELIGIDKTLQTRRDNVISLAEIQAKAVKKPEAAQVK